MSLLDLFSSAASNRAARQNAAAIAQGQTNANAALTGGRDSALGYLGLGSGGGGALAALSGNFGQARDDVTAGYDAAAPALARLGSAYAPMVAGGQRAFDAYFDAIGANGADGSSRAAASFQAAPGYQYARDQALEAVQRTAAARGGLAGGNTTADILRTADGLASQGFQNYVDNLRGGTGLYTTALGGLGSALSGQAQASQGYGNALGALGTGLGTGQAGIYGQGASITNQFGQNSAGVFQNATGQTIANNNNLAQSRNAAGANILNALTGGLSLLSGGAGSAAGRSSPTGGANVSPYAGNPFLSGLSALGNMFS